MSEPSNQYREDPLTARIREKIAHSGRVTFAQFMEWALYDPDYGYYSVGPEIGPRGDFTTSPEASPLFGRALAVHVAEVDSMLGSPQEFNVIECGPGRGTLARDLLNELASEQPGLYGRLRYWLVDVSPGLQIAQKNALLPPHGEVVRWAASLTDLPAGLLGALIANEVVDAFPVHVLENRGGQVMEHYVDLGTGTDLRTAFGKPSDPRLLAFLQRSGIELQEGQRTEVNLAVEDWMLQVASVLGRGIALIIDYGSTAPERYSEVRKEGTLLGYVDGTVTDNVLARPGRQDLTALVDFTHLQTGAEAAGLEVVGLTRQANFLLGVGLGTTIGLEQAGSDLSEALKLRRGLQALVSPEGLGRFQVLLLSKGISLPEARKLSGLKYVSI